jgi:CheY-like chemotaxis protein/tetratricopeptide (TPR) repeat protein
MAGDCAVVYLSSSEEAALVRNKLASFGVQAELATTARELGVAIERHSPVVLVLDGPLAERSGVEPLRWLRQAGLDIPAIFLCASSYECDGMAKRPELRPFVTCRDLTREVLSQVLVRLRATDEPGELPLSGALEEVDVTTLLLWALKRRWTGRLALESGGISKTIFLDSGLPVFCSSNILSENFGRLLLKRGIIHENDYERARELQLKERIRQGEALIRLGVLSAEALPGYLRDQVEEKLVNAVAWSGGSYALEAGESFRTNPDIGPLNPLAIAIEGERRFRSLREAAQQWPKMEAQWAVANVERADVAALAAEVLEARLRESLRAPRRLGEIAAERSWDAREAVAVFSVLAAAGYLTVAERAELLRRPQQAGKAAPVAETTAVRSPGPAAPAAGVVKASKPVAGDETVPPGSPPDDEVHELLEELYETYFRTASASSFKLLGIEASALPEQIVRARDGLLERFGDERFGPILDQPKHFKALQRLRSRIEEAAASLLDPKRRQFSRTAESSQIQTTREVSMKKLVKAEEEFRQGLALLDVEPRTALTHFSAAADLNPKDPLYLLYHGWSRYRCAATPGERTKGYAMIKRAVDANPVVAEGQLFLARVLAAEGRTADAIERARTALGFEPESKEIADLLESLAAKARPTKR